MFEDFPKNEIEFDRRFLHEQACLDYLFDLRWPDGFTCPECGHRHYWKSVRDLYLCRRCQKQVSVTAGTIFHGVKKPLNLWFKALWWFFDSHLRRQRRHPAANAWSWQLPHGLVLAAETSHLHPLS